MASNYDKLTSSRVAIIGAGVSGLAAAKNLVHHNPTVFEASDSVGGVWRSCTYETTKLQSARVDYEFSDFPWPNNRDDTTFPPYLEILDYLESYAKHFDLLKFMKFGSKVIEVRFFSATCCTYVMQIYIDKPKAAQEHGDGTYAASGGGQDRDHVRVADMEVDEVGV